MAKMGAHIGGNLLREVGSFVGHGQQDSFERDPRVQSRPDSLQGPKEGPQALKGKILTLDRNQDGVGGRQRVHDEQTQTWRGVEKDEVEVGANSLQRRPQSEFAGLSRGELHLESGQIGVGLDDLEVLDGGPGRGRQGRPGIQSVVQAGSLRQSESGGQVALGIKVDGENPLLGHGQTRGQVDGGGGLAHATLLICYCDHAGHWKRQNITPPRGPVSRETSPLNAGSASET